MNILFCICILASLRMYMNDSLTDRRADDVHVGASLCLFIWWFYFESGFCPSLLVFSMFTQAGMCSCFLNCAVFFYWLRCANHHGQLPYLHAGLCQFCRCILCFMPIIRWYNTEDICLGLISSSAFQIVRIYNLDVWFIKGFHPKCNMCSYNCV